MSRVTAPPPPPPPATKLTGRLAGFDPSAFANDFVSVEEVLEIKKAFDLFDYDGGGSIDPKGSHWW
jgi:hypothetical protein